GSGKAATHNSPAVPATIATPVAVSSIACAVALPNLSADLANCVGTLDLWYHITCAASGGRPSSSTCCSPATASSLPFSPCSNPSGSPLLTHRSAAQSGVFR